MKNSINAEKKKGLGALDVIIILALVACVIAGGFAWVFKQTTVKPEVPESEMEEYDIFFEIYGMRRSTRLMLKAGDVFYTSDSEEFGVLNDGLDIDFAAGYVQNDEGKYELDYAPENGDYTKEDVSGSLRVKGVCDERGFFLLNGETELIPNKSITIKNNTLTMGINIVEIHKVSD